MQRDFILLSLNNSGSFFVCFAKCEKSESGDSERGYAILSKTLNMSSTISMVPPLSIQTLSLISRSIAVQNKFLIHFSHN